MSIRLAFVASVLVIPSAAFGQQAVQWRVEDGGNGHWYQVVEFPFSMSSRSAVVEAIAALGAHPAVFETADEWSGYRTLAPQLLGGGHAHIGLFRDPFGDWMTFEGGPIYFSAWGPSLPNNYSFEAAAANAHPKSGSCGLINGCWEDYGPHETGWRRWVIEWSADCDKDGIVDYGQILDGTHEDANSNGVPDCCEGIGSCEPCYGDVTGNGYVDGLDLAAVLGAWGTNGKGEFPTDRNGDDSVDAQDLALVLSGWGACP